MELERIGAFVEYVARPLVGDIREILGKMEGVISREDAKKIVLAFGIWHIVGELIRAFTYLGITWIICRYLLVLLSQ